MFLFEHSKFECSNYSIMASLFRSTFLLGKYHPSPPPPTPLTLFISSWEWLFSGRNHYLLVNNNWGSTNFPGNNDWVSHYFRGVIINCYTGTGNKELEQHYHVMYDLREYTWWSFSRNSMSCLVNKSIFSAEVFSTFSFSISVRLIWYCIWWNSSDFSSSSSLSKWICWDSSSI